MKSLQAHGKSQAILNKRVSLNFYSHRIKNCYTNGLNPTKNKIKQKYLNDLQFLCVEG